MSGDVAKFSAWLHRMQHPAECGQTVGHVQRQEYFWGLGLGAQLVSLKFGLLAALLKGHVYHLPTSHYTNPVACPSRSFDCYFEPASNCTPATHRKVIQVGIRWCTDVPEGRLGSLAGLAEPHPKEWFHAQLTAFLFRPSVAMRSLLVELSGSLTTSDPLSNASRTVAEAARGEVPTVLSSVDPAFGQLAERAVGKLKGKGKGKGKGRGARRLQEAAGGGGGGGGSGDGVAVFDPARCVAVHVRRTDKFKTRRREDRLPPKSFSEYAQLYRGWAYWRQTRPPAELQLLVGSEDKHTYSLFPPLVAPSVSYWVPPRFFVMDMSEGKTFKSINQGNSRLEQLYAIMSYRATERNQSAAALAAVASSDIDAAGLLKDCDERGTVAVGSYASNVAVLVHDLMAHSRLLDGGRFQVLDVNGRSYCGCGASFCMTLEKKALRDPTRSTEERPPPLSALKGGGRASRFTRAPL